MPRGVKSNLRQLVERDPKQAREVIEKRLAAGATIKSLADVFNLPYNTMYRLLKGLGINTKTSSSPLANATGRDWATLDLFSLGLKFGCTYTNVHNYREYHKEEVDGKVRRYLEALSGANPTKDPEAPLASNSRGDGGVSEQLPRGGEEQLPEGGPSSVDGDEDSEDGV